MNQPFQAAIFDLDGVIIQSEELHAKAKQLTLDHFGIAYPGTLFNDFKGRPDLTFWNYVAHNLADNRFTGTDLDAFKRKVYFKLATDITLIEGVWEYLSLARKRFRQLALVSSATEPDLRISDEKFGIQTWFDIVLLGEDTVRHKPHPEPYLRALTQLKIEARQAMVIEDSPNGVMAAKAAGCYVMGITTGFTADELLEAGADRVADSYAEIARFTEQVFGNELP